LRAAGVSDVAGRVRAIAIARVADRYVATAAPDNDLEIGFVSISELRASSHTPWAATEASRSGAVLPRDIAAFLVDDDQAVQLLTPDPLTLVDADTGEVTDPHPNPDLVARALTGRTNRHFTEPTTEGALRHREPPRADR
jgi:hypothetical protein